MVEQQCVLDALFDRHTGIITSIDYVAPLAGGPPIHTYRCALAHPYSASKGALVREDMPRAIMSGSGLDRESALWAMLGEAVERYAAYSFDESRAFTATLDEIEHQAVAPEAWITFAEESITSTFPYQGYDRNAPIRWTRAHRSTDGAETFVPAVHVWLRLGQTLAGEGFVQRTSTGLGAGTNIANARLSGLLEVIERDAFASRWLLGAGPARLCERGDITSFLQDEAWDSGIEAELYDLAVENYAPVVLAKLELPHQDFGLCLGASAALTTSKATYKALVEAYHILQGMLHWHSKDPEPFSTSDVKDFVDHGRYYSQPCAAASVKWFFNDEREHPSASTIERADLDADAAIQEIVTAPHERGYETYFVDVTPDDIREIGFWVVKTLIPGLQPLTCGERVVADDPRRLMRVSTALSGSKAAIEINRQLQPFA